MQEVEICRLKHAILKALPSMIVSDGCWMDPASRSLAEELWLDGVRARPC